MGLNSQLGSTPPSRASLDGRYVKQDGSTPITGAQTIVGGVIVSSDSQITGELTVTSFIATSGSELDGGLNLNGGTTEAIRTITGTANILATDIIVLLDATAGNVLATLPAATVTSGSRRFHIKRIDSSGNTATVQRAGADTIDGGTSVAFAANQARELRSIDTAKWGIF